MPVERIDPVGMHVRLSGVRRVVLQMWMVRLKFCVLVLQDFRIARRPKASRKPHADQRDPGVNDDNRGQARGRPEPPGKGIGQEPAGVTQRKLRGKQRRPVFVVG